MDKIAKKDILWVLSRLENMFETTGALEIGGAYESIVAVALSARTRDEQVLKLLPAFFGVFSTVEKLASADVKEIEERINTIGMYRQKAKNLKAFAEMVSKTFNGVIPDNIDDLVKLPGVGRKTASVILPYIFNVPAIAVDTHVHRVVNRLGWVKTDKPEKTEKELLEIVPKNRYATVNKVFVKFGRYICLKNPRCWACPLVDKCQFKYKNLEKPKNADAIMGEIAKKEKIIKELKIDVERILE